MASKLFHISPHQAESQIEISLREAFSGYYLCDFNRTTISNVHFTHLDPIVTDGCTYALNLISNLVYESYSKLLNLIWATWLVEVSAIGIDNLLAGLLRQIVGLISLCLDKFEILLEEPLILTSALCAYLRLLKLQNLKKLEIDFCVRMLRKHFQICFRIGRDLVRLLQYLDLLSNPLKFGTPEFLDISQLYCLRTSSRYFYLGFRQRWKKFFCRDDGESVICDIVRFICCAHHPPNEITSVITDNVLNIEPGILLVRNLVPRYIDMTWTLVQFIFFLMDNCDMQRKNLTVRGLSTAFHVLLKKGV
ncbi:hypothetical protein MKW92_047191, partial [Papaver armeniacum]